jgi:hypothetical protein
MEAFFHFFLSNEPDPSLRVIIYEDTILQAYWYRYCPLLTNVEFCM